MLSWDLEEFASNGREVKLEKPFENFNYKIMKVNKIVLTAYLFFVVDFVDKFIKFF